MEAVIRGAVTPRSTPSPSKVEGGTATAAQPRESLFRISEIFFATVDRILSPGAALISAKGQRFTASTEAPLREGGLYCLQVKAVHPRVVLRTVRAPENRGPGAFEIWAQGGAARGRLGAVLQDLARSRDLAQLSEGVRAEVRKLEDLLRVLLYPGPDRADGKWVEQAFMASGIFWEERLLRQSGERRRAGGHLPVHQSDLKGLLVKLIVSLEGLASEGDALSSLSDKAKEALECIRDQQLLNLHGGPHGWYGFLPGSDDAAFRQAEFFGKSLPDNGEHRLSLQMEFSRLGRVEADLTLGPFGLRCVLRAEDRERAAMISNHLGDLEASLRKRAGISLSVLRCELKEGDKPPDFVWDPGTPPAIDIVI